MDPLRDWHKYVEELSRPTRPPGEQAAPLPRSTWRPWQEGVSPYLEGLSAIPAGAIRELSLGAMGADTQHLATREMEDPTLHDYLPPPPPPPPLQFQPPSFVVEPGHLPKDTLSSLLRRPLLASREPVLEALEANGNGREFQRREREVEGLFPEEATPERQRELRDLLAAVTARSDDLSRSLSTRQELMRRLADPTLSLEEAALLLDVCPTTVRRYTNRGILRHFRTEGNQRRFRLSDILEFLEQRSRGSVSDEADDETFSSDT